MGTWLRDVMRANEFARNFRVFGPDETASNRLGADLRRDRAHLDGGAAVDGDDHLSPDGRVMEVLSEHLCQGWLEGYLLTGRHGLFNCYEAFIHIVDSMFNQHAKWLKVTRESPGGGPSPRSTTCCRRTSGARTTTASRTRTPASSTTWSTRRPRSCASTCRPDANCLLSVADHCLRSRDYVNVIVAGKQPSLDYLSIDDAITHCTRGIGIWDWASTDDGGEPDVVLACAGDIPTLETLAAAALLRRAPAGRDRARGQRRRPDAPAAGVGAPARTCPTPSSTRSSPPPSRSIFAYHGYPWLIHRLTYRRRNHHNLHVRGYKEEGTTTTPFDMVMLNDLDRFHLVMDVIDRVPGLGERAAGVRQQMADERLRHRAYTREYGDDPADVRDWTWPRLTCAVRRPGGKRRLEQPQAVAAGRGRRRSLEPGARRRRVRGRETDELWRALAELPAEPDVLAHRVVHGGERFREAVRIDDSVLAALARRSTAAGARCTSPSRSPGSSPSRAPSRHARASACFDTAFHATLSCAAATYALPRAWRERHGLRRYGFHGLSHAYAARRAADLAPRSDRLVTCHLGAGASLCAVLEGRSIDTTMGFTPLEGLCNGHPLRLGRPRAAALAAGARGAVAGRHAERAGARVRPARALSGTADMRELLARDDAARGACRGRLRASPARGHRRDGRHARRHRRPAVHGRRR